MAPVLTQAPRYASFATALNTLRATPANAVTVEGTSYSWSRVGDLEAIANWLQVTAAIERIQLGGQAGSIGGRSQTQADLQELYKQEAKLRALLPSDFAAAGVRNGIRVRYGVPV